MVHWGSASLQVWTAGSSEAPAVWGMASSLWTAWTVGREAHWTGGRKQRGLWGGSITKAQRQESPQWGLTDLYPTKRRLQHSF